MQIAALNPAYLDKSTVPAEALDKEKEILMAQIQNDPKNSKKPHENSLIKARRLSCSTAWVIPRRCAISVRKR